MESRTDAGAASRPATRVADRVTRSGVSLHIRPATPDDAAALAALFAHVGADDLRARFGGTAQQIGSATLSPLLADEDSMTFLAFADTSTLVAAATLADQPDGITAEVALSVHAQWKGRGVAWTLLEHTLAYATAHGLREVTSYESGDDRAAINLEREMGFVARLVSASPVELSLSKIVAAD